MKVAHWLVSAAFCVPAVAAGAAEVAAPLPPADAAVAESRPEEVGSKDWSYQAVEDLARRGLIHGYKDAKFLEGRTLTRYEMASIVKRVLDRILQIGVPSEPKPAEAEVPGSLDPRAQGVENIPTGKPQAAGISIRDAGFRDADLPVVRRLADAYSVELAVIGVNLQDAIQRMAALEGRLDAVEKTLQDPKGPLQKAITDITRLDKIRFSGYVQFRYESFENTREADPPGPRIPITDRFTIRRMRMTLNARPTNKTFIKWEFEGSSLDIQSRDTFVSYFVNGNPATGYTVTFGQMKVPFGFEIAQSSGQRETLERARVIRFFYPSERDRGIKVTSPTGKRWIYDLGLYNGVVGPGTQAIGLNDNNNNKDVIGRIRTSQLNNKLDAGFSFHLGNSLRTALFAGEPARPSGPASAANPYENERITLGADVQYQLREGTELRGEFLWGKAKGSYAKGYILQALHDLNPKNQFVVRYDWLGIENIVPAPLGNGGTPVGDSVAYRGTLSNLAVGLIHRLETNIRLKLFYEMSELGQKRLSYGRVPWQGNVLRFEILTLF